MIVNVKCKMKCNVRIFTTEDTENTEECNVRFFKHRTKRTSANNFWEIPVKQTIHDSRFTSHRHVY